jgi:ParB family chromosome partitioning protein
MLRVFSAALCRYNESTISSGGQPMHCQKINTYMETGRVVFLPFSAISPNPNQPRTVFSEESLAELSQSIRRHGVLQPLSVRRIEGGYQLIAGERRLRAAKEAGLSQVPCVLLSAGGEESAVLAVIENLQREDLDMFEEAEAIARLMAHYSLTQEEVAERLSFSQSCVANKLRLLRLEGEVRQEILEAGLSERHARALLRLPEGEKRKSALAAIRRGGWNVTRAEAYIEECLQEEKKQRRPEVRGAARDVRLFSNSLDRTVDLARKAGILRTEDTQ